MVAFFFFFFPEFIEQTVATNTEEYYSQIFADRLKAARQKQNPPKTQKQLASEIGVTTASLCNYEKGLLPSLSNVLKLADNLGVPLDYLFGRGSTSELYDKPSLGIIARNIITLNNQNHLRLETQETPALVIEHERLSAFLKEYLEYSKALGTEPNGAMQRMFDAWLNSQLKELDQIPLE